MLDGLATVVVVVVVLIFGCEESVVVDFKRDLNIGLLLTELVRLRNLSTNFALS